MQGWCGGAPRVAPPTTRLPLWVVIRPCDQLLCQRQPLFPDAGVCAAPCCDGVQAPVASLPVPAARAHSARARPLLHGLHSHSAGRRGGQPAPVALALLSVAHCFGCCGRLIHQGPRFGGLAARSTASCDVRGCTSSRMALLPARPPLLPTVSSTPRRAHASARPGSVLQAGSGGHGAGCAVFAWLPPPGGGRCCSPPCCGDALRIGACMFPPSPRLCACAGSADVWPARGAPRGTKEAAQGPPHWRLLARVSLIFPILHPTSVSAVAVGRPCHAPGVCAAPPPTLQGTCPGGPGCDQQVYPSVRPPAGAHTPPDLYLPPPILTARRCMLPPPLPRRPIRWAAGGGGRQLPQAAGPCLRWLHCAGPCDGWRTALPARRRGAPLDPFFRLGASAAIRPGWRRRLSFFILPSQGPASSARRGRYQFFGWCARLAACMRLLAHAWVASQDERRC